METLDYWPLPAAYLLGSVPFGLILPLVFAGKDVRQSGSGNIGSTNVIRTAGKGLGAAVQILDILKGVMAALLCRALLSGKLGQLPDDAVAQVGGFCATIGHCYPLWLKFKGGKGVNAALGGLLVAGWLPALLSLAVFLLVFLKSRMASLGSIAAAAAFPLLAAAHHALGGASSYALALAVVPTTLLIIWRHRENIGRIRAGNELKM